MGDRRERLRGRAPERVVQRGADGLLNLDAISDLYVHLHRQPRSAWTQELDLRPVQRVVLALRSVVF